MAESNMAETFIDYNCCFGDCLLRVHEQGPMLRNGPFSRFLCEKPYRSTVTLKITRTQLPAKGDLKAVTRDQNLIVYAADSGWMFESGNPQAPCTVSASPDYSELRAYLPTGKNDRTWEESFLQLLRVALECRMIYCGLVSIHASCVSHNGAAILFTGPSGTGKSTQAALWQARFGAEILSGDRPLVGVSDKEIRAYGVPWDGKEQIFLQKDFPVKAIAELRQANENRIRKLDKDQAFRLLMTQCFIPMWDDEAKFLAVKTIRALIESVPFYRMFCLPNEDAAELLNKVLFSAENSLTKRVQRDMKIVKGFILRNVAGEWIAMPAGDHIKTFEGAVVLNEVSAFIWKQLSQPISREDLLSAVLCEFDIDQATAAADLDEFLALLDKKGFLQKD